MQLELTPEKQQYLNTIVLNFVYATKGAAHALVFLGRIETEMWVWIRENCDKTDGGSVKWDFDAKKAVLTVPDPVPDKEQNPEP